MTIEQDSTLSLSEFINLPSEQRRLAAVRKVIDMRTTSTGGKNDAPWPITLKGYKEHAIALVDLVWTTSKAGTFGLVVRGKFEGHKDLIKLIDENSGIVPVKGGDHSTTVLHVKEEENGIYFCKFGYASKGSSIERAYNEGVKVNVSTNDLNLIINESLYRLYKLTGKLDFLESLGIIAEMQGRGSASAMTKPIDPDGHYSALGLNPYALRFLDQDYFQTLITGIKKEVSRKMHPDWGHKLTEVESEYLRKMLLAADVLGNADSRNKYSRWLNMENGDSKKSSTNDWKEI